MKLLHDIIELLSTQSGSLTEALLKTKVVLHKIGHTELVEWVNDELNGYPPGKGVPPYRIIPVRTVGHLQNAAYMYSSQTLPISHLDEKQRKHFSENELRESIRVLEDFASNNTGHLAQPIAPELYPLLGKALSNVWITNAWIQMEPTQIMNAVIEIRSRLLDFILSLQDKLGDTESDINVKQVSKHLDIPTMFKHTVIGDNATFIIGENNTTTIKNDIKKGDFDSLAATLKQNGVADDDVQTLKAAILADGDIISNGTDKKSFGPAVKRWMSSMMDKAINTAWAIELNVAGGLLTNALQSYYFS